MSPLAKGGFWGISGDYDPPKLLENRGVKAAFYMTRQW
jgi:hypothetical protein